jgi:hypothetical protein
MRMAREGLLNGKTQYSGPPCKTSLDQLLFKMKILFTFIQKSNLNEVFNCTDPSPSVGIPWIGNKLCLFLPSLLLLNLPLVWPKAPSVDF